MRAQPFTSSRPRPADPIRRSMSCTQGGATRQQKMTQGGDPATLVIENSLLLIGRLINTIDNFCTFCSDHGAMFRRTLPL